MADLALLAGKRVAILVEDEFEDRELTGPLDARALGTYSLESFPNPFTVVDRGGHGVVVWNEIRQSAMLPVAGAERKWFMPLEWGTFELNSDFSEGTFNAAWGSKTLKVTRLK